MMIMGREWGGRQSRVRHCVPTRDTTAKLPAGIAVLTWLRHRATPVREERQRLQSRVTPIWFHLTLDFSSRRPVLPWAPPHIHI